MQLRVTSRGIAMLAFTAVVWGAMFAVAKSALASIDAYWLSALRYVPASLTMLVILWLVEGRKAWSFDGAFLTLWFRGTLGFAGFSILGYLGLARSRPEHAAIIVALLPLIGAMIGWLVHGRRPSRAVVLAMAIAFAGVVLVVSKGHWHALFGGGLFADALVLAGVVCWIGYTMGAQSLPQFSTVRYTALSMALGTVSIVTITLVATLAGAAHVPAMTVIASTGVDIAYLSLAAGVLAVLAWNGGIAALGTANGFLFINLVPIVAFAIGIAQGRRFGPAELAGALLVIGALIASNLASRTPLARSPKFA
ncbi:MAG TPA: DMT family transporter [Casimicrobiaceae bacterium]|nr:DMT family transporter [Casimicrobiaceae bacterium]